MTISKTRELKTVNLSIGELDRIIENNWTHKIKKDFLNNKLGYHESTLVASFSHYLRKDIDKDPRLRIYLEDNIHDYDSYKRFDIVIYKYKGNKPVE